MIIATIVILMVTITLEIGLLKSFK